MQIATYIRQPLHTARVADTFPGLIETANCDAGMPLRFFMAHPETHLFLGKQIGVQLQLILQTFVQFAGLKYGMDHSAERFE